MRMLSMLSKCEHYFVSVLYFLKHSWVLENVDNNKMHLIVKTGIDWLVKPNIIIKGFIEKDITDAEETMGKYLRSIYALKSSSL